MKHLSPFYVRKRLSSLVLDRPFQRYVNALLDQMAADNRVKIKGALVELFPLDTPAQAMEKLQQLRQIIHDDPHNDGHLLYLQVTDPLPADLSEAWLWFEGEANSCRCGMHGDEEAACRDPEMVELEEKSKPVVVFYQNEMMLDWVNGAVVVVDRKGRVTEANNTALAALGWRLDEFVGRNLHETIHHSMDDGCTYPWEYCPVFAAIEDGSSHHVDGDVFWRADGDSFQADLIVCPARNEKGEISGAVLIFRNLTEKKLKETSRIHRLKLESIGVLAAGIAHEINSPLQFIADNLSFFGESFQHLSTILQAYQSYVGQGAKASEVDKERLEQVRLLEKELELEYLLQEVPEAVQQTLEGVERVSHLIQGLKGFANSGSNESEQADINEIVKNAVIVCQSNYAEVADLQLELQALPQIRAAVSELGQAVANLVSNAAAAIADKQQESGVRGKITVGTKVKDRDIVIQVSDTGVGIPPPPAYTYI